MAYEFLRRADQISHIAEQLATRKTAAELVLKFKEEQEKQTELLEKLLEQAQSIGKTVACGERRQDEWTGAS